MPEPTDTTYPDATYPDATMRYGATDRQVADVFEPDAPVDSLVLLLHGGRWGDADRMRTWPAGRAIAAAGHLTATVEYRGGPGQWAAALDDVVTAIDQIQLSGREWTRHNDAPRRITLVGHSSGGHLALWAAGRGSLPESSRWRGEELQITGVVALAPAADLAAMSARGIGEGAVESFLGGTPAQAPEAYAVADPIGLPPGVPVEILHGGDDDVLPIELSQGYADRAAAAGGHCRLDVVPGADHDSWGDPTSAAWPHLLDALTRLTV